MTTTRTARVLVSVTALALLWSLTGCTGSPSDNRPSDNRPSGNPKETPLATRKQADVAATLKTYGQATATLLGAPLENWATAPAPCEGPGGALTTDGRFDMTGNANIAVPAGQHIASLQKLRDQWKQQGYEITEYRTFPPDNTRGTVSARNPADNITISAQSTAPPQAFALLIATPCYHPAPGETPTG